MTLPPPPRAGLGNTFKRPTTIFVLPTGHDPNTGPVIVLDGTTGKITIIGTGGQKIVINPDPVNPELEFYSDDGTSFAFINQPASASNKADLGMNSGQFTPADTIARTIRSWLSADGGIGRFEVINALTQKIHGGFAQIKADFGAFGYWNNDIVGAIPTDIQFNADGTVTLHSEASMTIDSKSALFVTSAGDQTYSGVGYFVTSSGDQVYNANGAGSDIEFRRDNVAKLRVESGNIAAIATLRVEDNINIGFPGDPAYLPYGPDIARCNANTLCGAAATLAPGTPITFTVKSVNDVFLIDGTIDISPQIAPTSLFVGNLFLDNVAQTGAITYRTSSATDRESVSTSWLLTGLAAGNHTIDLRGSSSVANQYLMNTTHTVLRIDPRYRK